MSTATTIESTTDFKDDPTGRADRWSNEMVAADKEVEKWLKEGTKIVDRFLDMRTTNSLTSKTRLNIFNSNITTLRGMLYGQVPGIDVKRRYDDANDDAARVAANILERMLNNDIDRDGDNYVDALRYALDDRLLPGLGCARVRYDVEFEEVEVPAMMGPGMMDPATGEMGEPVEMAPAYTEEKKVWEDAPVDYINWKDVRWSPARTWGEVRWIGFLSYMTKDQVEERFGKKTANAVPYESAKRKTTRSDALEFDPWKRCKVWEIWNKDGNQVEWWVKGYDKTLDTQDDPLQLEGFYPCPKFLLANPTTSSVMPRADFTIHRDLYNEIDFVSTRIERLERAVKAVGCYDQSAVGVQRMLQEGFDNDLIPVENWANFTEKGGIGGTVQWMPLVDIVNAMDKLRDYRKELIELLNQTSGMADIMRGASTQPNVTATEQGYKARFASVRVTAIQDEFAEFASGLQALRAEIIVKHFDDETIVERSNIMSSYDAPLVPQALALLRDKFAEYKIRIEPDNIARADYAALKNDRVEFLTSVGQFIGQVLPMAEKMPETGPMLVEMVRWASTGFRGGDQIETVVDQFLDTMKQQGQKGGDKADPEKAKLDAMAQQEQARSQGRMAEVQAKSAAKLQELQAKSAADQQRLQQETAAKMAEIQAELDADLERERAQSVYNIQEEEAKVSAQTEGKLVQGRFGVN